MISFCWVMHGPIKNKWARWQNCRPISDVGKLIFLVLCPSPCFNRYSMDTSPAPALYAQTLLMCSIYSFSLDSELVRNAEPLGTHCQKQQLLVLLAETVICNTVLLLSLLKPEYIPASRLTGHFWKSAEFLSSVTCLRLPDWLGLACLKLTMTTSVLCLLL